MNIVLIHAKLTATQASDEDGQVEGAYRVTLADECPSEAIANAALDLFHYTIPIAVLDDFEIWVTADGQKVLESDAYENGSLRGFGATIVKISHQPDSTVNGSSDPTT